MWRCTWINMVGLLLVMGAPAAAQGPGGKDGPKMEAELDRLRSRIQDLEAALKKQQGEAPDRRPRGEGFGKKKDGQDKPDEAGKKKKDFGGEFPWKKKADGKGPWGEAPPWAKTKDWAKSKGDWAKKKGAFAGGPPWMKKKDGGDKSAEAKGPWAKGPWAKGPWGKGAWGKDGRGDGSSWSKKKDGKGGYRPPWMRGRGFGGAPWGTAGYGRGMTRSGDLERRLERIQDEIEQLRREIRRR